MAIDMSFPAFFGLSRETALRTSLLILCLLQVVKIDAQSTENTNDNSTTDTNKVVCKDGVFIPMWNPTDVALSDKVGRAIVYFLGLIFMFLGVSIIADRFMSAIEVITSKEKEVQVIRPNGDEVIVSVRIWNETVSNLTLMALGSSAPEILLSVIEICGKKFKAGDLGPSTIVGSAAFNLFVIIAICVYVIPDGEIRKIKHLRVFFVTATFSILAYIWLYMILETISKNVVDVWEALLTLMLFPVTVVWAYVADKRIFFYRFLRKKYTAEKVVRRESHMEMGEADTNHMKKNHDGSEPIGIEGQENDALEKDLEEKRKNFVKLLQELKHKHPEADLQTLEQMANYEALNQKQKSRAFYRIQATRKMCGAGNILKKTLDNKRASIAEVKIEMAQEDTITRVFFDPASYTVMENVGSFSISVVRQGGDMNNTIYVDYKTSDGTANAGSDYHYAEGTLVFKPGEVQKDIYLTIIDDDVFEEDEHFFCNLDNIRVGTSEGMFDSNPYGPSAELVEPTKCQITILDDDHAGIFHFEDKEVNVSEATGVAQFKVVRSSGARGVVRVPFKTIEGTAKGNGKDFDHTQGEVEFQNDEVWKYIEINIIDDEEYEKNVDFAIELGTPSLVKRGADDHEYDMQNAIMNMTDDDQRIADLGLPQLGENTRIQVRIMESQEFKNTVDKLIKKANLSLVVGTSSWREQFTEALAVSAGDEEGDDSEEKLPSCLDYVMHFLTIFWKILFAFVPPTDIWGGWACFCVSICMIGILTGVIGDLASSFGCTIQLKDSVTAISFVALGTSVPDTFASKVAAVGDKYADASIGNVTGSNAVNVFLGIGIAWSLAAIYHAINSQKFTVETGSLGFSVTLFTLFALVVISVLMVRRKVSSIGGELGGPKNFKMLTTITFVMIWMLYIMLCSFEAYGYIEGF
ncbi:sodium/calcium exchanger 1-like isoform X2 [Antedon mediterranea]|uniref:sodium/calcium exchanger 1-like isoform X2 n=1 Tax=Antedon mediterranea TaxID=105859 RepID=UPI003AF41B25